MMTSWAVLKAPPTPPVPESLFPILLTEICHNPKVTVQNPICQFQSLAAADPKILFIEFVLGFDNISVLLLLLNFYLSESEILSIVETFSGH
jgi:hypothetical protein